MRDVCFQAVKRLTSASSSLYVVQWKSGVGFPSAEKLVVIPEAGVAVATYVTRHSIKWFHLDGCGSYKVALCLRLVVKP